MKTLSVAVLLAVALPCLVLAQATSKQAVPSAGERAIQEVTALERAWIDAGRQHDVAWFERNLAASCILTDENGVVMDKAATIADVKAGANQIESESYENLKVQAYGDTAVATGISVIKGTYKGKDSGGKFPWTDTWVKRGGQWQCVASHNSKIAPEAATAKVSDISGTYTLVSINGNNLPFTPPHEGGSPMVRSGTFTINNDGTCSSKVAFSLPSGADTTREVSASYTREGSKLTMKWTGAGTTIGTVEGNTFTMDNEGMIFAYRK